MCLRGEQQVKRERDHSEHAGFSGRGAARREGLEDPGGEKEDWDALNGSVTGT